MRTIRHLFLLAAIPLFTTGCGVTVQNMTPAAMTRNPSGLYPISVEVIRTDNSVVEGTVRPHVVLPDQTAAMIATPGTSNRWEYTVAVPSDVSQWPYHFKIDYMLEKALVRYEPRTQLDPPEAPAYRYVLRITDRTAVGLDARRARIGSLIKVLGRGFKPGDQVLLNGQPVPTTFENENTVSFRVPPIAANQTYPVEVSGGGQTLKFGDLLVDLSQFVTSPAETPIAFDATAYVGIAIPQPAPAGGLSVRLQVNDPELLQMPDSVVIPEGQSRAQVAVRAIGLGAGTITMTADGFSSGVLPFRVNLVKSTR